MKSRSAKYLFVEVCLLLKMKQQNKFQPSGHCFCPCGLVSMCFFPQLSQLNLCRLPQQGTVNMLWMQVQCASSVMLTDWAWLIRGLGEHRRGDRRKIIITAYVFSFSNFLITGNICSYSLSSCVPKILMPNCSIPD